jgi:hypothetical protein
VAPGAALLPANPKIFDAQYAADLQIFIHIRVARMAPDWFANQDIESVAIEKTIDTSRA